MEENNKQLLQWQEELVNHKERLQQAIKVKEEEEKIIALIEGGIQYAQLLQKKVSSKDQPSNTKEQAPESKKAPSKSQVLMLL